MVTPTTRVLPDSGFRMSPTSVEGTPTTRRLPDREGRMVSPAPRRVAPDPVKGLTKGLSGSVSGGVEVFRGESKQFLESKYPESNPNYSSYVPREVTVDRSKGEVREVVREVYLVQGSNVQRRYKPYVKSVKVYDLEGRLKRTEGYTAVMTVSASGRTERGQVKKTSEQRFDAGVKTYEKRTGYGDRGKVEDIYEKDFRTGRVVDRDVGERKRARKAALAVPKRKQTFEAGGRTYALLDEEWAAKKKAELDEKVRSVGVKLAPLSAGRVAGGSVEAVKASPRDVSVSKQIALLNEKINKFNRKTTFSRVAGEEKRLRERRAVLASLIRKDYPKTSVGEVLAPISPSSAYFREGVTDYKVLSGTLAGGKVSLGVKPSPFGFAPPSGGLTTAPLDKVEVGRGRAPQEVQEFRALTRDVMRDREAKAVERIEKFTIGKGEILEERGKIQARKAALAGISVEELEKLEEVGEVPELSPDVSGEDYDRLLRRIESFNVRSERFGEGQERLSKEIDVVNKYSEFQAGRSKRSAEALEEEQRKFNEKFFKTRRVYTDIPRTAEAATFEDVLEPKLSTKVGAIIPDSSFKRASKRLGELEVEHRQEFFPLSYKDIKPVKIGSLTISTDVSKVKELSGAELDVSKASIGLLRSEIEASGVPLRESLEEGTSFQYYRAPVPAFEKRGMERAEVLKATERLQSLEAKFAVKEIGKKAALGVGVYGVGRVVGGVAAAKIPFLSKGAKIISSKPVTAGLYSVWGGSLGVRGVKAVRDEDGYGLWSVGSELAVVSAGVSALRGVPKPVDVKPKKADFKVFRKPSPKKPVKEFVPSKDAKVEFTIKREAGVYKVVSRRLTPSKPIVKSYPYEVAVTDKGVTTVKKGVIKFGGKGSAFKDVPKSVVKKPVSKKPFSKRVVPRKPKVSTLESYYRSGEGRQLASQILKYDPLRLSKPRVPLSHSVGVKPKLSTALLSRTSQVSSVFGRQLTTTDQYSKLGLVFTLGLKSGVSSKEVSAPLVLQKSLSLVKSDSKLLVVPKVRGKVVQVQKPRVKVVTPQIQIPSTSIVQITSPITELGGITIPASGIIPKIIKIPRPRPRVPSGKGFRFDRASDDLFDSKVRSWLVVNPVADLYREWVKGSKGFKGGLMFKRFKVKK